MSDIVLHQGDNRDTLRRLIDEGVRVHSVVTDPPYGLVSIKKRFGGKNAKPAHFGTDGAFQRAGAGFMNQTWDGSGIERDPEFWRLVWEILLPGGYCLAFSGARTGHWQAVAMEQAGFDMHPMTGWVFGSGFPKAHDAAKAIDKMLGAERPVVGKERISFDMHSGGLVDVAHGIERPAFERDITTTATPEAAQWEGWKYGAAAMKPALEPIYVGQKPWAAKTGARNLLEYGVGALNIDGCRVEPSGETLHAPQSDPHKRGAGAGEYCVATRDTERMHAAQRASIARTNELGRHPANLCHDGSDEVRALFGDSKGQIARTSSSSSRKNQSCYGEMCRGAPGSEQDPRQETDSSAARFFNAFPVEPEAFYYHAKASTKDRVTQCTSCGQHAVGGKPDCDCEDRKLRGHPTVKPIGLMRHLVRLVTPPGGSVLDPFAGTGTTGAAARAEGFDCILMEADESYCSDIRARLDLPVNCPISEQSISEAVDLPRDIAELLGGYPAIDPVADLVG